MFAYVRGEAYLLAHRGEEAAAELRKIIDHRGVVVSLRTLRGASGTPRPLDRPPSPASSS